MERENIRSLDKRQDFFFGMPRGMWDGIEPVPPAVEARSLNHWTAREVPDKWQDLKME